METTEYDLTQRMLAALDQMDTLRAEVRRNGEEIIALRASLAEVRATRAA